MHPGDSSSDLQVAFVIASSSLVRGSSLSHGERMEFLQRSFAWQRIQRLSAAAPYGVRRACLKITETGKAKTQTKPSHETSRTRQAAEHASNDRVLCSESKVGRWKMSSRRTQSRTSASLACLHLLAELVLILGNYYGVSSRLSRRLGDLRLTTPDASLPSLLRQRSEILGELCACSHHEVEMYAEDTFFMPPYVRFHY